MTAHNLQPIDRFMRRVEVLGPDSCWEWHGGRSGGMGMFSVKGRPVRSARWAYTHFVGAIANGEVVRQSCGNKMCVRPEHLEL